MRRLLPVLALAVLLAVPAVVEDSYTRHLFIIAFLYAVIASNWDLTLGYAGLFNFGHLTFFGAGVYTAAILAKTGARSRTQALILAVRHGLVRIE